MQLTVESSQFGTMRYYVGDETNEPKCDEVDIWQSARSAVELLFLKSNTKTIVIHLNFLQQNCIHFCPYFSKVPFTYKFASKINVLKIIVTFAGCITYLLAFYVVKKVWILNCLLGFFVGGILWVLSFLFLLKKIPQLPSHIRYQIVLCLLPVVSGTTYGIFVHFTRVLIGSLSTFFLLGLVSTYWYGCPHERSVNLVAYFLKFVGLLLIIYAQYDNWLFLTFFVIVLPLYSIVSICLNFESMVETQNNIKYKCRQSLCLLRTKISTNFGHSTWKTKDKMPFRKFNFISKEQFESNYMNTPKHLNELAGIIRDNPLLIRKVRLSNRSIIALFSLDPEFYYTHDIIEEDLSSSLGETTDCSDTDSYPGK